MAMKSGGKGSSQSSKSSHGNDSRSSERSGGSNSSHSSHTTTDHEQIRQWIESRGGKPACVRGTGNSDDIGMLRIDFPGYSGEASLQHVSWDEFFQKFDESNLAFLYQNETSDGSESRFFKLVSRENPKNAEHGRSAK